MTSTGVVALTAVEAIGLIKDGSLTAERYAFDLLQWQRANADLNTVTWIDEEKLLEAARATDLARARGETLGLLAGAPVAIKDNIDTVGFPTSAGTAALKTHFPRANAPVVDALLRHGASIFAKVNMHELAGGGTSSNPVFGAVRNPYDLQRIPGGSSGGTAAALAARLAPLGLGTDTAGSVRIPSALCGTVGLRPSTAGGKRYSDQGVVPIALDLDTVGPMARVVADVALLHQAITGDSVPDVPALRGVRLGLARQHYWEDLDPEVERVAKDALARLREAGAELVEVDIGGYLPEASDLFFLLLNGGTGIDLDGYFARSNILLGASAVIDAIASQDTKKLFQLAQNARAPEAVLTAARGVRRVSMRNRYAELFRSHGIAALAFPTEPMPAPLINPLGDRFEDEIEVGGKHVNVVQILIRNTLLTCALGAPGLSLPAGLTSQGLPVGLELDGLPGSDSALLGLGLAVEAILGRMPPPPFKATVDPSTPA